MLKERVIDPRYEVWASPVVLVQKKEDTKMGFCIDYRKTNAVAIRAPYPIPRMDKFIDFLGYGKVFTTLGTNCSYWQVEIA